MHANNQVIHASLPIEDVKNFKEGDFVNIQFPKDSAQVIN